MPTAAANEHRLEHIDLVRGYALLGVLLMNIQYWFRNPPLLYWSGGHPWPGQLNLIADVVLKVWFEGKSVTLFAMLFAIGLCMQRENILAKDIHWGRYASRRLGAMIGFGALHILLFWNGDVLHQYAFMGLLILPFLKRKPKTLSWWVGTLFSLATVAILVVSMIQAFKPPPPLTELSGKLGPGQQAWAQALIQGYAQHSWVAVMRTRLWDWVRLQRMLLPGLPIYLFITFLTGLWIWSRGILQDPAAHRSKLGRIAVWGLGLGLAANLLTASMQPLILFLRGHWGWAKLVFPFLGLSQLFGQLVLATGIGATLVWLWQDPTWRERLRPLTFVGRMGFTNYILQSVVCTFIFYGWGLGLYNRVGPALGTLIGLGLFALQIPLSRWWLQRYHFGPLEWLWRALTYGHTSPFRRAPLASTPEPTEP
jgi:uncharacterized protein